MRHMINTWSNFMYLLGHVNGENISSFFLKSLLQGLIGVLMMALPSICFLSIG